MQKNISAMVFDFDNVIVLKVDGTGSEEVKDAAWPEVFGEDWKRLAGAFPAMVKRWSGGKGSRFDIVRDALAHLGFQGDLEKEVRKLCEDFNRLVQEGIVEIGVAPGARAFLKTLSKRLPLFINSATPTSAMNETLERLGIKHLFREVYGQEGGKAESIRRAMAVMSATDPKQILFVGDSPTDYEAAKTVGCRFIGVGTKRNKWKDAPQPFPVISGTHELEPFV